MLSVEETLEELKRNRDYYKSEIISKELSLNRAKELNSKRQQLQVEVQELTRLRNDTIEYRDAVRRINKVTSENKAKYETERIEFINDICSVEIARIFPEEDYRVIIEADLKYSLKARIKLKDRFGHIIHPQLGAGGLLQYMITFSAVTSIGRALDLKSLYIDEAFPVSAKVNLEEIGKIIADKVAEGFQIILISQDPMLYEHIPRRELVLDKGELAKGKPIKLLEVRDIGEVYADDQ